MSMEGIAFPKISRKPAGRLGEIEGRKEGRKAARKEG